MAWQFKSVNNTWVVIWQLTVRLIKITNKVNEAKYLDIKYLRSDERIGISGDHQSLGKEPNQTGPIPES